MDSLWGTLRTDASWGAYSCCKLHDDTLRPEANECATPSLHSSLLASSSVGGIKTVNIW